MTTDLEKDTPPLLYDVHVFCCINQRPNTHQRGCCASKGSLELANYMCRRAMMLRASSQRIRINLSGCLNACEYGPTMVIYPEGVWYHYENHADIAEILEQHIVHRRRVDRLLLRLDPTKMHC